MNSSTPNQTASRAVTPFQWREYTEREQGPGRESKRASAKASRPQAARDRAERILAHRWSGAYSKAGPV